MREAHSTIDELQSDVESMCQWLESRNIRINKNRVASYRKTFETIANRIKEGTAESLKGDIDFARQADNFHDVSELTLIHQQLSEYDSPVFRRTLEQAVNGPTLLASERPQTSDARNKVYELVTASQLRAAGFKPRFVEPTDALVTVNRLECFLECKRIQSEEGLVNAIQKASRQTEDRIAKNLGTARGLFAVDLSKVINPTGKKYFSAASSEQLAGLIDGQLSNFFKRNIQSFRKHLYPFIACVFLYVRTPAVIEGPDERLANYRRLLVLPSLRSDGKNKTIYQALQQCFTESEKRIFG
jgi:hypothetical protein